MLQAPNLIFWQRLAVTIGVLTAYRLASFVPVPGLTQKWLGILASSGTPLSGLSIGALGIVPLLSALTLVEMAKMLGIRRRETAPSVGSAPFDNISLGLAIAIAAILAANLAVTVEDLKNVVAEPGLVFRATYVATLVAGVAAAIFLVRVIDTYGLGSGLWLLFLVPTFADLIPNAAAVAADYGLGDFYYSTDAIVQSAVFVFFATAAIVRIVLAGRSPLGSAAVASACVWPIIIATTILGWLLTSVSYLVGADMAQMASIFDKASVANHVALALLAALLAWLYARSYRAAGLVPAMPAAPIAAALAGIVMIGELLYYQLGRPILLYPEHLVTAAAIGSLIAHALREEIAEPAPQSNPID